MVLRWLFVKIFKRVHDLTKNMRSNNMRQIVNFKALKMITKDLLLRCQGSDARKQTPATQAAPALSSIFAPQIRWAAKNCRKSRHKQPLHWIDGMSGTKLLHKQRTLLYYIFIDVPVHGCAWTLQGGGAGNGAFSALGLHVECMGATMYGGGEATAGENWSLQDKSPKTHPCGDSADVRFQNCKEIQKQEGIWKDFLQETWCMPALKKSNFGVQMHCAYIIFE